VSISLHPGTSLSLHAGSVFHRIGRLFKYAIYYVVTCGEVEFLADESKAVTESAKNTRDNAGEIVKSIETGDTHDGIEISGSQGAINSLYAGTAPAAGELNGKVRCFIVLSALRWRVG
jgi:hypothetical protein